MVASGLVVLAPSAVVAAPVSSDTIGFDDFWDLSGLVLNGRVAQIPNPVDVDGHASLRVLDSQYNTWSTAFWKQAVSLRSGDELASFSQNFRFRITGHAGSGADGIAFLIGNSPTLKGGTGGGIGYAGLDHTVVAEFDTWHNGGIDPDGNHVGISLNGDVVSITRPATHREFSRTGGCGRVGWTTTARRADLEVRASADGSRPADPATAATVDIPTVVGADYADTSGSPRHRVEPPRRSTRRRGTARGRSPGRRRRPTPARTRRWSRARRSRSTAPHRT